MAKTPIYDPGSSEARSSWLVGLAEACSKMSGVLDMATGTFEDLPLPELFISNDDRYRIYQAPPGTKLWLSATIKKNGAAITEDIDGFTVNYLGGSVVFDADKRLTADDVITASGAYIIGYSDKLESISSDIDMLSQKAGKYKGYYDTVEALAAAQPTASNGDYAIVGETESFHVWSGDKWVDTVKVTDLSGYYTSAEIDDLLDDKQNSIPTHGADAASDAYYYGGRKTWQNIYEKILSAALTGFAADDDSAVTAVDTVLTALGKLQAQINSNIHPLKGTGAPTTSTVGVIGQEYINTSNGDVYRCTAIQDGSYTWVQYQDKLTGTEGQIVGFDASGKAIAQAPPDTGVTSFNGRSGDVTPQEGDYTAEMVNARPDTWMPTAEDVGALSSDDIIDVAHGGTGNSSVDTSPVSGSTKMITSGGVYNAFKNGSGITGVIPVSKGGTGNSSVDTTPTSGSTKMVTSDGLFKAIYGSPSTVLEFKSFSGCPLNMKGLAYGNGILLGYGSKSGYSYTWYSVDNGKTWVQVYRSDYYNYTWYSTYGFRTGVYEKNRFVVGGPQTKSIYSDDAVTWQECINTDAAETSTYRYLMLTSIAFSGSYFVGIDTQRTGSYLVVRSTDGINWSTVKNDDFKTISAQAKVLYGNGKFIIAFPEAVSGKWYISIYYSTTGTTWYKYAQCIDYGTTQPNIGTLCYGNGKYILGIYYGTNEGYYYSTDANTWYPMSGAPFNGYGSGYASSYSVDTISYCNGRFIYVGQTANGVYYHSTDAIHWASDSLGIEKKTGLCPMIYANGITIAGTLLSSSSDSTGLTVYSSSYKPI